MNENFNSFGTWRSTSLDFRDGLLTLSDAMAAALRYDCSSIAPRLFDGLQGKRSFEQMLFPSSQATLGSVKSEISLSCFDCDASYGSWIYMDPSDKAVDYECETTSMFAAPFDRCFLRYCATGSSETLDCSCLLDDEWRNSFEHSAYEGRTWHDQRKILNNDSFTRRVSEQFFLLNVLDIIPGEDRRAGSLKVLALLIGCMLCSVKLSNMRQFSTLTSN